MSAVEDDIDVIYSLLDAAQEELQAEISLKESLRLDLAHEQGRRALAELSASSANQENERLTKAYNSFLASASEQYNFKERNEELLGQLQQIKEQHAQVRKEQEREISSLRLETDRTSQRYHEEIRNLKTALAAESAKVYRQERQLTKHEAEIADWKRTAEAAALKEKLRYEGELDAMRERLRLAEEKNRNLAAEVQRTEQSALTMKMKLEEHLQGPTTGRQLDVFKQKILKLRKENEELKRLMQRS